MARSAPPDLSLWRRGPHALVLGHRGARRDAPENSLLAFRLALEQGAAGVELDVRLTKQGRVIVLHDTTLARVTDNADQRSAEQLSDDDLAGTDLGDGQAVPSLIDVLDWAKASRALLNIELKSDVSDRRALVWGTVSALEATGIDKRQIVLSSFHLPMLRALSKLLPDVPRGWLFQSSWRGFSPVIEASTAIAVHPRFNLISERRMRAWRRHSALVNTWTVNDPGRALTLDRWGIDTLISDVPGTIIQALDAAP